MEDQVLAMLKAAGFVRLKGVIVRDSCGHSRSIQAELEHYGRWSISCRNQLTLVLPDGDVWSRPGGATGNEDFLSLCPNGKGNFDMHASDEEFLLWDYFARHTDPYAECSGSPESQMPPGQAAA